MRGESRNSLKHYRDWMRQVSEQLEMTRKTEHRTHEYIQDIIDERNKLLQRCQIIAKIQDEYAAIMANKVSNREA